MTGLGFFFFIASIITLIGLLAFTLISLIGQYTYEQKIWGFIGERKFIILFSILTLIMISFLINPLTENYILRDSVNVENLETKIITLTQEYNEINAKLKNKPEKEIKKDLKTKRHDIKVELKSTKKNIKKENKNTFYNEKHISIFIIICIIDIVISGIYLLFYIFASIEFKKYKEACIERINSMSDFIANKYGSCQPIEDVVVFYDQYNEQIKKYDKELRNANDTLSSINSEGWFLNFGRTERLEKAELAVSRKQKEISKFKIENKTDLLNAQKVLKALGDEDGNFYKEFREEIQTTVVSILDEKQKKLQEENEKKAFYLEESKKKALENIQNEAKIRDKNLALQQKQDKVVFAINELKSFIPVLQNHISENKKIDFNNLSILEKHLDTIEDSKEYIPADCINDLERCQKKLTAAFNSCENKDDLQVQTSIDLIQTSFNTILKK